MKIVDANNCHTTTCDLVTLSKALSDNYRLDINCGHVELCGFTEYYFSEKKKCNPKPPLVLGKCSRKIKFSDSEAICHLVEEGIKQLIRFKDYICNVLDTDISYNIKATDLICKLIELTTTTTTTLAPTTLPVTTLATTLPVTTNTTTQATTSTTTTTQRVEEIKIAFEAYLCKLIENNITTTTTTLVDWRTTLPITTIPLPTTSTTSTTVDPSLPTTTSDPNTTTTTSTTTTTIPVTTSTTTKAPCGITINVVINQSEVPEFELITASIIKNDDPDQYELTIQYKVWVATTFAECQTAKIEFQLFKEDGTYLTTVSHVFDSEEYNVFNKPVDTVTDLFIFDPFLFDLNIINGTGDGQYKEGRVIAIAATEPIGQYFDSWTDPDNVLDNVNDATPNATMPAKDIVVTANMLPFLDLIVNNGIIIQDTIFNAKYGRLYNSYAVTDIKNIASIGWHVPTSSEVIVLRNYLGGASIAGSKMNEVGIIYWNEPNTLATNEVGFNARGAGYRGAGPCNGLKSVFLMICSNGGYNFNTTNSVQSISQTGDFLYTGCSVRLIKDSTILTHGQIGTYTGNDGKIYSTICIGTQEWISENLAETRFRDSSLIPIVTDNSAWAALTTAGMCSYNNDDNNI